MGAENKDVETAAKRSRIMQDAHRITRDDVWPIIIVKFFEVLTFSLVETSCLSMG